jgi:photosystem II stability/assembly factor-like uncharacterized protein
VDFLKIYNLAAQAFLVLICAIVVLPILYLLGDAVTRKDPPRVPQAMHVGHVHAMGLDPADGVLYLATARGLFWVKAEDWAERVGDSYQNTRGFLVVGPNQFIGSGNPDIRDTVSGLAPRLSGFIRSESAGRSWRTVSLEGEASFHALDFEHAAVYGYESESKTFRVSTDNARNWDTRSEPPAELIDVAVDSASADTVLATTSESALLLSADGGRSWSAVNGSTPVQWIEWPETGVLWGFGPAGRVMLSGDSGRSWEERSPLPGPAEAVLLADGALYAAVYEEDGITVYISQDGARSWQRYYRDPEDAI